MAHEFPDIRDIPDGLDEGLYGVLSDVKEVLELMLRRREASYLPEQDFEPVNKVYADGLIGIFDRGDASSADFEETDLTTDGSYHELDLSSVVPTGTKAVLMRVRVEDDVVDKAINFRKNGNSNVWNKFEIRTQVANIAIDGEGIVFCDDNQIIEYYADNNTFTTIDIVVKGYWK